MIACSTYQKFPVLTFLKEYSESNLNPAQLISVSKFLSIFDLLDIQMGME